VPDVSSKSRRHCHWHMNSIEEVDTVYSVRFFDPPEDEITHFSISKHV
jgi:hypothetical protein